MWEEVARSLTSGDAYILLSVALGLLATVFAVERMVVFTFVYSCDFQKFIQHLRKMLEAKDYERARSFCKSVSGTSLPSIALQAIDATLEDPASVKGAIDEAVLEFLPRMDRRVAVLPGLATLAVLVGVLGTVDRLWHSFHSVDVLDTAKKQVAVATGIASALNPTAFSLFVALVVLVFYQIVRSMAASLVDHLEHGTAVLTRLLVQPSFIAPTVRTVAPTPQPMSPSGQEEAMEPVESSGAHEHENFADAGLEDIKDEEEII